MEELYNEPNIVNVIKSNRLRRAGHVVRMDENELPKGYRVQTLEVTEDVADRNQDGLARWRKAQGNWVVESGWRLPRKEDGGDICLRRSRPNQGSTADDDAIIHDSATFRKSNSSAIALKYFI